MEPKIDLKKLDESVKINILKEPMLPKYKDSELKKFR